MRTYEARYKIQAHIYECMTLMPDSEDHYETRQFKANTNKEAIQKAEELKWDAGKTTFNQKSH